MDRYVLFFIQFTIFSISRKDWFLLFICLALILISLPIPFMKKYTHTKAIFGIPRSRITPAPASNTPEQGIEMNNIESTERMNIEQFFQERIENSFQAQLFNTTKYNKNIVSVSGISILITILFFMSGIAFGSRYGWISLVNSIGIWYICFCCLPVILPTIYFNRKPNHFISVMKDLNIL